MYIYIYISIYIDIYIFMYVYACLYHQFEKQNSFRIVSHGK